jgi:hypothetical protein
MVRDLATRRSFLGGAAGLTAIAGAGYALGVGDGDDAASISFEESFDDSAGEWTTSAEILDDSVSPSDSHWQMDVSDEESHSGTNSMKYMFDATQGHGGIWATRDVSVEPGTAYDAELTACLFNERKSWNKLSTYRVYFGPDEPQSLDDFLGPYESFPVYGEEAGDTKIPTKEEGWSEYPLYWQTPELETDTLYLTFGIQSEWETTIEHYLDDISVTMTPR